MKLKNLIHYKDFDSDNIIFNSLTKSTDDEILTYIINVTSDLLNGVFLVDDFKIKSKENLMTYDERDLGELATYMCITPFIQSTLSKEANWQEKATSYLECFIGYIIGTMDKEEFLGNLIEMKDMLNMSNKFYTGLIDYFSENKKIITNGILNKLQF